MQSAPSNFLRCGTFDQSFFVQAKTGLFFVFNSRNAYALAIMETPYPPPPLFKPLGTIITLILEGFQGASYWGPQEVEGRITRLIFVEIDDWLQA